MEAIFTAVQLAVTSILAIAGDTIEFVVATPVLLLGIVVAYGLSFVKTGKGLISKK